MLGITFSPQNYHHHQQFLSKLRENNENDMTSVVWAVIVFGPRVWPLSACRHYVLRDTVPRLCLKLMSEESQPFWAKSIYHYFLLMRMICEH